MPKFLDIKLGDRFSGTTQVKRTELGEQVLQTELDEPVSLTADPGDMNLQIGKRRRGSLMPILMEDGSVGFRFCPQQSHLTDDSKPAPEVLGTTEHGRIYRNSKQTRVVFEFPLSASFSQISDALDDEIYEMRESLERGK